ncbi:DUF6538 domain-containing protein [Phaeobacter sp. JH209B]|uniref:DUF6538 domain-containing protein n=1 Tax=Phaeobacter sp. JH209B TaxID=3112506 RepID=UPI003A858D3B
MLNWHAARVSRRGQKYYVVLTVPKEARAAVGSTQLRMSTGTSDLKEAEKKRCDLELQMRQQIMRKVQENRLSARDSAFQTAVRELGLTDVSYLFPYCQKIGDVVPQTLADAPPKDRYSANKAIQELSKAETEIRLASLHPEDPSRQLMLLERFDMKPPSPDKATELVANAKQELERSFGDSKPTVTLSSYLGVFESSLSRRVENGNLQEKTSKSRLRNIGQFIDVVGDLELTELEAKHAYQFAKQLEADGKAHRTIQTRISDVTTMLTEAVQDGELKTNPFTGLKLARFGKTGRNYTPLNDRQLEALFSIRDLPKDVRDIWAVLICTGMRLDEAALCRVRQVSERDGILFIDLRDARVKNEGSRREVPVCDTLAPLIRARVKDKKSDERLFGFSIKSDGKSRASEQCSYWLPLASLPKFADSPDGLYATHSLRGTFKDKLRDAEVNFEVNNAILGHDQHTVSATYGRGPSLQAKKEAVDRPIHRYLGWISEDYPALS